MGGQNSIITDGQFSVVISTYPSVFEDYDNYVSLNGP